MAVQTHEWVTIRHSPAADDGRLVGLIGTVYADFRTASGRFHIVLLLLSSHKVAEAGNGFVAARQFSR
jgi:hypothetical protein